MDEKQRRLHDLDNDIASLQDDIHLSRRSDPLRTIHLQRLSKARLERYTLSKQHDGLEQSILSLTEVIHIQAPCDTRRSDLSVVLNFNILTHLIFLRAKISGQPEDVRCCVHYLRFMRGQWHGDPNNFPLPITTTLVSALALQVALKVGDVDQDIEEIADLCNELLSSNISIESLSKVMADFAGAAPTLLGDLNDGKPPSSKIIDCLRKATMRLPDLHEVFFSLAMGLLKGCEIDLSDTDYKEGMANLDKLIGFRGPGGRTSPYREEALYFATLFATTHFQASGKPEDLEQAIYRMRTWSSDEMSFEDPHREFILEQLSHLRRFRQNDSNIKADFQNAQSSTSDSEKLQSFRDLTASLPKLDLVEPLSLTTITRHSNVLGYDAFGYLTDIADIEDGVNYCRQLLVSYSGGPLAEIARRSLSRLFRRAFKCTNEIEYLNKAISATRDEIDIAFNLVYRMQSRHSLISLLSIRLNLLRCREDLDELMQLFPIVANSDTDFLYPIPISCQWALTARRFRHHSTATAYDHAMSSIQASVTLAPTLDIQHSRLVATSDILATLPLDFASFQIHTSQLKQAIETLERGRVLLWSEMRGLRTSIDGIRLANPDLADKFSMINRNLEALTLAFSPNHNVSGFGASEEMDAPGHLVLRQRKLLDDREKLISQIQALPGFSSFLKPPSFDILYSAACHGPVIIINHSKYGSDIVIIPYDSPPSVIPTSDDFYARANKMQGQLLGGRKKGLESNAYEDALRSVLKELYELVGCAVIKRLNELNVPEQSRVWWCPTSVFCCLPLHAMGPIPSDVGPPRYFLDQYIPSYIPSLSSLIESRKPGSQLNGKPSILLVAQPDEQMPQALREMKAIQAINTKVTTLFSAKATPTAVLGSLRVHRFAHMVCHGMLEPGKPFEASFKLHRGRRLLLMDIIRSQFANAEFAFLSACHSAELTDESIADEVLHLAAAMQFCGFRSVVGTMWAMADIDGPDLVKSFYASVLSDEVQGGHYYERTAGALRDAVVKLRRKGGITLERWVNFVHYGA